MAEYRVIAVEEAPYDDGAPTGRWFAQKQIARSRDEFTGELEWHDLGLADGPYEGPMQFPPWEHEMNTTDIRNLIDSGKIAEAITAIDAQLARARGHNLRDRLHTLRKQCERMPTKPR